MPDGFRPAAKAIIAFLVIVVAILVGVGLLDIEVGTKITADLIALAVGLGIVTGGSVYATRNYR